MHYNCLIVDDEEMLGQSTKDYLNMFEVKAHWVSSIQEARKFLLDNTIDLLLLDINLTDGSGFEFCKELRQTSTYPILFISARNTDTDKIIALSIGGDDYIEKPYSLQVLLAKVKVILKRFSHPSTSYSNPHFCLDRDSKKLLVEGKEIKTTVMEFKLLEYLIENKGKALSKEDLFYHVWGDRFTQDGTLNVHIRHLREYIEPDPQNPRYIVTIWGVGYRFED